MSKVIVHVIDSLGRGGAETLLVSTVKSLPEYKHTIITLYDINDFVSDLDGYANIQVMSLGAKGTIDFPIQVPKLRRIILELKPDIVHSSLYWSTILTRFATPKNVLYFFSNQCLQREEAFKKRWMVWLEKLTYTKNHNLISVSKVVEEEYQGFIGVKGKHWVLRNYANDCFFQGPLEFPEAKTAFKFITVGRLHPQKKPPVLGRSIWWTIQSVFFGHFW